MFIIISTRYYIKLNCEWFSTTSLTEKAIKAIWLTFFTVVPDCLVSIEGVSTTFVNKK